MVDHQLQKDLRLLLRIRNRSGGWDARVCVLRLIDPSVMILYMYNRPFCNDCILRAPNPWQSS